MSHSDQSIGNRIADPGTRPDVLAERTLLIDARKAAARCGMSVRTWLRLADAGRAPWGIKLGGLRRWNVAELDQWIAGGCRRVRSGKGGAA